jgi:corrinoid protein of di/trimethylamine methyltransferase
LSLSGYTTSLTIEEKNMSDEIFAKLAQAVIDGEPEEGVRLARLALDSGVAPLDAINQGLTKGIQKVGELFASGEYFLPDLVIGGETMKQALAILEPALLQSQEREVLGRVVLGTVAGDLHEIGKTLVGTMLIANGFQVFDLGVDVPVEKFAEKAREVKADIVGLSALLTTTMVQQEYVIEALDDMKLRPGVKVMVGGAPVTENWAQKIGADAYAEDAISAVAIAKKLVS